ncbi:transcription factor ATOH8 isoform X1 [Canis lupus baileyi]|uniref:transcription factor ATOH8 isoform X1 n=2 Tax=Canis lupus baileyi TaxID=143281 RepID=UPI003B9742E2
MKHIPVLEDGPWKTVCVKELNGLKKLKRKGKEPARRANGYKTFRLDLEAPERAAAAAATNGLRDGTQRLQPVAAPVPAPAAPAVPSGGGADPAGERRGARAPEVPDARKRGFALGAAGPGLPTPPPPPPPPGQGPGGPEAQPFREPGLRPRILLCAPPARPTPPAPPAPPEASARPAPPTRPGESSYSSISHVIYNNHPDSSASPRKRPGEAAAAASEIKALQQTRRLLANARERTRVHTISAAFEALRKQVPCYSYGQKLSKLAILRIACNYILSLARLADLDYSADHSNLSFSECVQRCTRTLQAEGRAKKRKAVLGSEATSANKTDRVNARVAQRLSICLRPQGLILESGNRVPGMTGPRLDQGCCCRPSLVKPEEKVSSPNPALSSSPRCRQMLRPLPLRVGQGHTCLPLTLLSPLSHSGDSALCPLPRREGRAKPPPCPGAAEIHCQRFHKDIEQIVVIKPHGEKPHHGSMTFAPPIA